MLKKIQHILSANDLKGKFARGTLVLSGASAFEIGLRFIRNIVLTRLLAPEYFGLMATIMSTIAISEAFTEVGVRRVVIQNKKGGKKEFLNVAWWFSSLRGACLYIIAFIAAPYICEFFRSPGILLPMRLAFTALVFQGLISPRMHALEKEMNYFKLIIIRQGSAILNVSIAIIFSFYYKNIWPLVIGFVIENLSICLFSFLLLPFRPSLIIERLYLREILKFARRMIGLPILATIFFQFDIFIIGRLLSMEQLGLYSVARTLAMVPITAFSKTVIPVVLPLFSKLQDSKISLAKWLLKITDLVALICMPAIALSVIISKPLLSVLFGPKYGSVSIPFSILMLYIMIRLLSGIIMQLILALGRPDLQRRFAFIRVLLVMVLAYPATKAFGLVGASSTVLIGMLVLFVLQVLWALKLIHIKMADYMMCLGRGLAVSSIVILPSIALRVIFPETNITMIVIGVILCLFSWGLAVNTSYYKAIIIGESS